MEETTHSNTLKRKNCTMYLRHLHPNISMYILHTVLYTFLIALIRGILLKIESFSIL